MEGTACVRYRGVCVGGWFAVERGAVLPYGDG